MTEARKPRWTWTRTLIALLLVLMVLAGGSVGFYLFIRSQQIEEGAETHEAVCALKHDLEDRVGLSERFLLQHPRGAPGIPAVTIRESVRNQQRTISALSVIDC